MNPLLGLPFLLLVAAVILLSGYWLNALKLVDTVATRLALAAVGGLASLILVVVAVNFFQPLAGIWLGVCLLPAATAVLVPWLRRQLVADGRSLAGSPTGRWVLGAAAVFLLLLFQPALRDWQALFYDGTTNHDSFISITAGEYLQHHRYLEVPELSSTQPWMNMAQDNAGWRPRRAQLGVETLLALFSGLAGTTPLHVFLYFAGALFLPWIAAVYLAVTTFFRIELSRGSLAALVLLQPVFVFFYANSNLPNLLGAILGATIVVATEQALRATNPRRIVGWCTLVGLGFHGQIAAYPEMIPFILLPCGLLWLRPGFGRRWAVVRRNVPAVAAAFVMGAVINPVVTVRAWHGFQYSFGTARADVIFANLFAPLSAAEHVPGFATLAIPAALGLGPWAGAALSLMILSAAAHGWWRARDRLGALFTLAGTAALMLYTVITDFNYGWQKSMQFGAIFVVAFVTAPVFDALFEDWPKSGWRRIFAIAIFYAAATAVNFQQINNWSRQKKLSHDWYSLRELSAGALREQPVLVESASFRMPFFHSMWATYFLDSSRTYFARRGGEGGGYLRLGVRDESAIPDGQPAALLVGRSWAESFDANSPRLLAGREYILFREANRVTDLQGVYPLNGIPDNTQSRFSIEITPHSASRLRLTLAPNRKKNWPEASWRIVNRSAAGAETVTTLSGPPPWQIDVALEPRVTQTIDCQVVAPAGMSEDLPFSLRHLIIESTP
jgi:hypothetical protein